MEGRVWIDDVQTQRGTGHSAATSTGGVLAVTNGPSTLVTQRAPERVADALAWRDGMLKFDQAPLSEVATEFNRYNRRQIVVTDPDAAAIRIGGTFQASNVDAFARLQIGRASCRERVCQDVEITVGAVSLKKKKTK